MQCRPRGHSVNCPEPGRGCKCILPADGPKRYHLSILRIPEERELQRRSRSYVGLKISHFIEMCAVRL